MTRDDMRRSVFEDKYPPPEGVEWVEELGYYSTKDTRLLPDMDTYNEWFDVWVAALHSVEAEKEPVTQEMIKAGLDAIGPCMGSCGEASPPDGEDVEACYLAMKALDLAATGIQPEKDAEWLRLEVVGPELGEDVDIWLFDGSILIECQIQTDGDFYCNAIFGEFFVCASNVIQWKPTSLRRPAPPEHKP